MTLTVKQLKKTYTSFKKGMTSIELVVVFGIFAALAGTVLFNYRGFQNTISLHNVTQDIALLVREAQNKSVSGSIPILPGESDPLSQNWAPSYGVYMSMVEQGNLHKNITLFFDRNSMAVTNPQSQNFGDWQIDTQDISCPSGNASSECLDVIQITGPEFIDSICFNEYTTGACESQNDVHIVFIRPLNRAYISYTGMSPDITVSDVVVYIGTGSSDRKTRIIVTSSGQIIVE